MKLRRKTNMNEDGMKEVYFGIYCKTCKYFDTDEDSLESPCDECLSYSSNLYSHKPVKYKPIKNNEKEGAES